MTTHQEPLLPNSGQEDDGLIEPDFDEDKHVAMSAPCVMLLFLSSAAFVVVPIVGFCISYVHENDGSSLPTIFDSDTVSAFGAISYAIYCAYFGVVTVLSFRQRQVQPFKARNFCLLLLSSVCGFILRSMSFAIVFLPDSWAESANRWTINLFYPGLTVPYLLRALRLFLVFTWSKRGMDYAIMSRKASVANTPFRSARGTRAVQMPHSMSTPEGLDTGTFAAIGSAPVRQTSYGRTDQLTLTLSATQSPVRINRSRKPSAHPRSSNRSSRIPTASPTPSHPFGSVRSQLHLATSPQSESLQSSLEQKLILTPSNSDEKQSGHHTHVSDVWSGEGGWERKPEVTEDSTSFFHTPGRVGSTAEQHRPEGAAPTRTYKDTKLVRWFLLAILPFVALSVVEQVLSLSWTPNILGYPAPANENHVTQTLVAIGFHALEAGFLLVAVILMWNGVWDAFNIGRELALVLVLDLAIAAVQVLALTVHDTSRQFQLSSRDLLNIRCAVFFCSSMTWPLFRSFAEPLGGVFIGEAVAPSSLSTLEAILQDWEAYECFYNFMFSENAVELLAFYVEVEIFRDIMDPVLRLEEAVRIYQLFIHKPIPSETETNHLDCGDEVNRHLQLDTVADIHGTLTECDRTGALPGAGIFDAAQNNILDCIRARYFRRFLKSSQFREFRRSLAEANAVRTALAHSSMVDV